MVPTSLTIESNNRYFPNNGILRVRLTLTCEDRDEVRVRVEQGGDRPSVQVTCNPEGNIVIGNSADDDGSVDFDFEISGDSSCRDDFTLADNDELSFKCDTDETYTITEDVPQGWELTEIDCDDENVSSRDIDVDIDDASVTIELSDDNDFVDCTFINQLEEAGSPNSVVLTASTTTPACGLPIVVLATVKDQGGNLLEGVSVIFTATRGTFTIQIGTTTSDRQVHGLVHATEYRQRSDHYYRHDGRPRGHASDSAELRRGHADRDVNHPDVAAEYPAAADYPAAEHR